MVGDRAYETEEQAYQALLESFWGDAPGEPGQSQKLSELEALKFLNNSETTSNASIALSFVADDELLLAGNLIGRGQAQAAWEWMDKSLAHAHLRYLILDQVLWRPSRYTNGSLISRIFVPALPSFWPAGAKIKFSGMPSRYIT